MGTKYQRAGDEVRSMAFEILDRYPDHRPILEAGVKIDYLFAYAERDGNNNIKVPALKCHGVRALAICRKIGLKDRAKGCGDVEICIDHDWWENAGEDEQRALLDHELYHVEVRKDIRGVITDDLNRPLINLRPHDVQIGWFAKIAARHGIASQERQQAKAIFDEFDQYFWPEIAVGRADKAPATRMTSLELARN